MRILSFVALCALIFAAPTLSANASAKKNFAVIGVKNGEGVSAGEGEIIADRLRINLFSTGLVVMMERDQMQAILKEQGFQQSGACSDEACMVQLGQMLGVQYLVSGSIGKLGSMYLLNFRTIDVSTAKIYKVVSLDITGGIEDVVGRLPGIAHELVGTAGDATAKEAPVVVKEKVPEPVIEAVAEEKPKEPEAAPVVVEKTPDSQNANDLRASRNKNRGGIRLGIFFSPNGLKSHGPMTSDEPKLGDVVQSGEVILEKYYDPFGYYSPFGVNYIADLPSSSVDNSMWIYPHIQGMIRIGKIFDLDIGPQVAIGSIAYSNVAIQQRVESYYGYDSLVAGYGDIEYSFVAPQLSIGFNFTKRFYPVKINSGIFFDVGVPITTRTIEWNKRIAMGTPRVEDRAVGFSLGLGIRLGAELLVGKNLGIAFDGRYRVSDFNASFGTLVTGKERENFSTRPLQFGLGINLYP